MKKPILFVIALLMFSIVFAAEESVPDETKNTGAIGQSNYKLGGGLPLTTVINNFMCSESADYNYKTKHGYYYEKMTDNPLCYTNKNHEGAVWIVWNVYPWKQLADPRLKKGEKYCVQGIKKGTMLDYSYYYCDTAIKTCMPSEWIAVGCDFSQCAPGEVLMKRKLVDLSANGCADYESKKCWKDSDFGYNCIKTRDTRLPSPVPPGPAPAPQPVTINLAGKWENVAIPSEVNVGESYEVRGTFIPSVSGYYYLEAGALKPSFAINVPAGSQCDGDLRWSGTYMDLEAGKRYELLFKPNAPSEGGAYLAVLGAYTGCLSSGGKDVAKVDQKMDVLSKQAVQKKINSYLGIKSDGMKTSGTIALIISIVGFSLMIINPYFGFLGLAGVVWWVITLLV